MENNRTNGAYALGVVSLVSAIQIALIKCYTSTDFEVHRNWMAITHQLPLSKWYFEETSEWTLDYPPFFAYFEKLLSVFAKGFGLAEILRISKEPIFNDSVLIFQRFSVIFTHLIYALSCYILCFRKHGHWAQMPKGLRRRARIALFAVLVANIGFFIVDSVHFQYNGLLTTFVILSTTYASENKFLKAAIAFCALLNFKHIYVYYAPAFVGYYLLHYFGLRFGSSPTEIMRKGLLLAVMMSIPFLLSFGPFFLAGGFDGIKQIIARLFPLQRGLTHAYWAPNFWALYNFADLLLYKLSCLAGYKLAAPTYTSGLVQEYNHVVLPSIGPNASLLLTAISLGVLLALSCKRRPTDFSIFMTVSAYSFFLFGYHVHEKAIILITIPLTIAAFTNPIYLSPWFLLNTVSITSLLPLLFTSYEIPIKYAAGLGFYCLSLVCMKYVYSVRLGRIISPSTVYYFAGLVMLELYNTLLHKVVFGDRLSFLPLMLISVYNSCGVLFSYAQLLWRELGEDYGLWWTRHKLHALEKVALDNPPRPLDSLDAVQYVGGLDISTCKQSPQLAVVTLSIFSYPELKEIDVFDNVQIITEPYVCDYLGIRECRPLVDLVKQVCRDYPNLTPQVLLVDGNGEFHSRGCGLASLVGSQTGIPTVGIAKNLNVSWLAAKGASNGQIDNAHKLVTEVSQAITGDGYQAFRFFDAEVMNIVRAGGSKIPVFVSSGGGISLEMATKLVLHCSRGRVVEPIRFADLRSRELVRNLYEEE
ncbi:unnamed protein product, partial [Mesorhabditis spiculigera]